MVEIDIKEGVKVHPKNFDFEFVHIINCAKLAGEKEFFSDGKLWITSLSDGTHSPRSFHYKGKAVDFRTRNFVSQEKRQEWETRMRYLLGPGYDFIFEGDHYHIEADKK